VRRSGRGRPAGQGGDHLPPGDSLGCPDRRGSNVKANRNCLNLADADPTGRSQANNETSVALDPATGDLVVGDNDYRRGDSGCVAAHSRNGGQTWSDSEVPTGFTRGDAFEAAREYWQGAGDPGVATDTRGNVYFSCLQFNRPGTARAARWSRTPTWTRPAARPRTSPCWPRTPPQQPLPGPGVRDDLDRVRGRRNGRHLVADLGRLRRDLRPRCW
jgi:hypothetical protein